MNLKLKKSAILNLSWPVWLSIALLFLVFGIALAIHVLTLNVRQVPTPLLMTGNNSLVTGDGSIASSNTIQPAATSSIVSVTSSASLLIPLGEVGQSIVQGEFGLLVDQAVILEPVVNNPGEVKLALVAIHAHITNFQGSYYKVRSLTGSKFRLLSLGLTSTSNVGQSFSLVTNARLAKQPILEVAQNMQFGDIVSGWLTFQTNSICRDGLVNSSCTNLEFQLIPANTSIPIRVKLSLPANH